MTGLGGARRGVCYGGGMRAPAGATVLLVDREALYRWFVAESLREHGVDVVPCASLDEVSDARRGSAAPDLVIVDAELLDRRDPDALRIVRRLAGDAPCLVLDSGRTPTPSRFGWVTVAVKPVDTAAVVALVTSQLRRDAPAA